MKLTYQYWLKLTKSKKQALDQQLKLCCWLYNYLLEQFRTRDKNKEKQLTEYQLINSLVQIKKRILIIEPKELLVVKKADKDCELGNKCWNCSLELDRDVNSAKNILYRAEEVWQRPSLEFGGEKLTASPLEREKYL